MKKFELAPDIQFNTEKKAWVRDSILALRSEKG